MISERQQQVLAGSRSTACSVRFYLQVSIIHVMISASSMGALAFESDFDSAMPVLTFANAKSGKVVDTVVSGRVVWDGLPVPTLTLRPYRDNNFCGSDGAIEVPVLKMDPKTKGVAGAVVTFSHVNEDLEGSSAAQSRDHELRIANCAVGPRVIIVRSSTRIGLESRDFVQHQCAIAGPNGLNAFEHMFSGAGDRSSFRPNAAGRYKVSCSLHAWEQSWIWVERQTRSVVTSSDGSFSAIGLPPGTYTASVWHPPIAFEPVSRNGRIVGYNTGPGLEAKKTLSVRQGRPSLLEIPLRAERD